MFLLFCLPNAENEKKKPQTTCCQPLDINSIKLINKHLIYMPIPGM